MFTPNAKDYAAVATGKVVSTRTVSDRVKIMRFRVFKALKGTVDEETYELRYELTICGALSPFIEKGASATVYFSSTATSRPNMHPLRNGRLVPAAWIAGDASRQ